MNNIFGLSGLPGLAGVAPSTPGIGLESNGPTENANFVDLLSLVEDLSLAQSQNGQSELITDELAKPLVEEEVLPLSSAEFFEAQKAVPLTTLAMNVSATSLPGLNHETTKSAPALPVTNVEHLLEGRQDLEAVVSGAQAAMSLKARDITPEAVQEWAAAFVAGDITKLEAVAEAQKPDSKALSKDKAKLAVEGQKEAVAESFEAIPTLNSKDLFALKSEPKENGNQTSHSHKAVQLKIEDVEMPVFDRAERSQTDSASIDFKPAKVPARKEAVSGSEFLLNQTSTDLSQVQAQPNRSLQMQPVFIAPHKVGEPGDNRIAPDALNFVSEKIEDLKSVGGGSLRLELNPKELGSIEVQVSIRQGEVVVKLAAEKSQTMNALNASKEDLLTRLSENSLAKVEVEQKVEARSMVARSQDFTSASSSELLQMKAPSTIRSAPEMHADKSQGTLKRQDLPNVAFEQMSARGNIVEADMKSQNRQEFGSRSSSSDSGSWQRDERREQARQKWEDFREQRSA